MKITTETSIEDLVNHSVKAVKYLREKGIKCIACGEPVWGTIGDAAEEKGFGEKQIEGFINDLNLLESTDE